MSDASQAYIQIAAAIAQSAATFKDDEQYGAKFQQLAEQAASSLDTKDLLISYGNQVAQANAQQPADDRRNHQDQLRRQMMQQMISKTAPGADANQAIVEALTQLRDQILELKGQQSDGQDGPNFDEAGLADNGDQPANTRNGNDPTGAFVPMPGQS